MDTLEKVQKQFRSKALFEQALTHRSWINENPGIRGTNERLEFLGDAVLEFVVSSEIYKQLEDKEEGFLTALRANLVNTQNLSLIAAELNVGERIYLSKGEADGGGRTNASLLADTIEAIIGAIYLDQGLEAASDFIKENILSDLEKKALEPLKDPKSQLQEKVQAQGYPAPKYKVIKESGPDHAKVFEVSVEVGHEPFANGSGKSKSEAEQVAARAALEKVAKVR